jgi:hypothetical protein
MYQKKPGPRLDLRCEIVRCSLLIRICTFDTSMKQILCLCNMTNASMWAYFLYVWYTTALGSIMKLSTRTLIDIVCDHQTLLVYTKSLNQAFVLSIEDKYSSQLCRVLVFRRLYIWLRTRVTVPEYRNASKYSDLLSSESELI